MSKSARHRRPPLSDAEREQRRAEQRELVQASIEQLRSSDGWQAYLKARRRLHTYSPRNVLLIVLQHETAETVAGFQAWLKLGYCVRKGEHAIKIWAPCPPTRRQLKAWRDAGADPDQRPRTHWRLASVFAQDQVDPLPPPAEPAPLTAPIREVTGDSHQQLLDRLIGLAAEVGYQVDLCADTGRADGSCNHRTKLIQIAGRLTRQRQARRADPRARARAGRGRARRPPCGHVRLRLRGAGGRVDRVLLLSDRRAGHQRQQHPVPDLVGRAGASRGARAAPRSSPAGSPTGSRTRFWPTPTRTPTRLPASSQSS